MTLASALSLRAAIPAGCMAALLIVLAIASGAYLSFWAVGTALEHGKMPLMQKQEQPPAPADSSEPVKSE